MEYQDKVIQCLDCGAEFVHSAEDQARYAERGFASEPKRCRPCREKRKAQSQDRPRRGPRPPAGGRGRDEGGSYGRSGGFRGPPRGPGGGGGRGSREAFEVVCASCGVTTTVPFKPVEGRPVYCRDCYRDQKSV